MVEWKYILGVVLAVCGFFIAASFLSGPIRLLLRVASYLVVGTILISVTNLIVSQMGLHIALNPLTVLVAGVLQIPGTLMLVVLNYFFI